MFEPKSELYRGIFDEVGIAYHVASYGRIEQSHVLEFCGRSIGCYFNDATSMNPTYFAINRHWFAGFSMNPHWQESDATRIEKPSYQKWIPRRGSEKAALLALLVFFEENL